MAADGTKVESVQGDIPHLGLWQNLEEQWSFGPASVRMVTAVGGIGAGVPRRSRSDNVDPDGTVRPEEDPKPPPAAEKLAKRAFGKRALSSVAHWEGVVERVEHNRFAARLVPIEGGRPIAHRPEFTQFEFDELSNDDDRHLVEEGAVFYWTLGRAKNPAGSIMNVSLLRFRRLPAVTAHQRSSARDEAEDLLRVLGGSQ